MSGRNLDAMFIAEDSKCSYQDIQEEDVDDVADIIDVLEFDDSDNDRWLDGSMERSESRVRDLNAWLRSDPEPDNVDIACAIRRSIDTRTFTRVKRRSNRLSIDTFGDAMPSTSNVWKNETISETSQQNEQREIPHMLRPKTNVIMSLFSESPSSISSQRSMEAFLDLAQANGIDSFINMSEPDFELLMNTSQPSMLYSSMLSDRDDSIRNNAHFQDNLVDSQILTDSMMQASMFQETQDLSILGFATNDVTIVDNMAERTFVNETEDKMELSRSSSKTDDTFTGSSPGNATRTLSAENILNQVCEISPNSSNTSKESQCSESKDALNDTYQAHNSLNTTIDIGIKPLINTNVAGTLNSTYPMPNSLNGTRIITTDSGNVKVHAIDEVNSTFKVASSSTPLPKQFLNLTFDTNSPVANVFNSTFKTTATRRSKLIEHAHASGDKPIDSALDYLLRESDEIELEECSASGEKKTDYTFDCPPREKEKVILNETFDQVPKQNLNATYKKPSDQKPLKKNLDVTFDKPHTQALDSNRFNTYRKDTFRVQNKLAKLPEMETEKTRFSTYSKKTSSAFTNQVAEPKNSKEPANSNFTNPTSKLQRRTIQAPKALTKLPQLFQKSNPNLASNPTKTVGAASRLPSFGNAKGPQLSARNKPQPLGKHKSGSDQQLMEVTRTITEFQMTGTGGSMESIESTQSAHSAPDLDDRLSMCSDSSHHSYTIKPMNIAQLHKIVQLQEENLIKDSTPIKRPVLQNTWVDEDLPSPILKIGSNFSESSNCSLIRGEPNIKTSSPNLSPASSDLTINIISNHSKENTRAIANQVDNATIKKPNVPVSQSGDSLMKKTGLKQPTNFTGSRPANATSGIPRPASRIPGPMFTRPKVHQALKKGC